MSINLLELERRLAESEPSASEGEQQEQPWVGAYPQTRDSRLRGQRAQLLCNGRLNVLKEHMLSNKHILLVEDDENDVLLIQRAFQKAGMKDVLKVARGGDEAIAYLEGSGPYANRERFPFPFMVLLDLKMPGTNGFEVLQWLRNDSNCKRLLVVVLTSSNLQADVDRAYELGANSYLVKPVGFTEMLNLIQRFEMYWSEINRTPSAPPAAPVTQPQSAHN